MKKFILSTLVLSSFAFADLTPAVENLNFTIKTQSKNELLVKEFSNYNLESFKEILIFIENFHYEKDFALIFNNLSNDDKLLIIRELSENLERFDSIIKELNLFENMFNYSNNMSTQEFHFHFYRLLLEDKENKFYNKILANSELESHYKTFFNPYKLIKLDKRYQFYIKELLNNGIQISYINALQYLTIPSEYKDQMAILSFGRPYEEAIMNYYKITEEVIAPISISSILYDKADNTKSINATYSFYVKGSLKAIIKSLNQKTNGFKYSHDLILNVLKENTISKLDLENYLKQIKFDTNKTEILNDHYFYVEVFDGVNWKTYNDIKEFLKENTIKYIY